MTPLERKTLLKAQMRQRRPKKGAAPPPAPQPKRKLTGGVPAPDCSHRRASLGLIDCDVCGLSGKQVEAFGCGVHGRCTTDPLKRSRGVRRCQGCPDATSPPPPAAAVRKVPPKARPLEGWAVGLTCVEERLATTLPRTLASLRDAGFPAAHLYADGAARSPAWDALPHVEGVTFRGQKLKTFGNWLLAAWDLVVRHPHAARYLLVQDDVVFCRGVREYLDAIVWPRGAYLNLFINPNQRVADGPPGFVPARQLGLGALALAFTREALRDTLTKQGLFDAPRREGKAGWGAVDAKVSWAAKAAGWREHVHRPSLVQHTGHQSVMGHGNNSRRVAASFPGEAFDARAYLKPPEPAQAPAAATPKGGVWRWHSTASLAAAAGKLASMLPPNCGGVIGVPRSGMIPAGAVATHLHLPLYELPASGPPRLLSRGRRMGDTMISSGLMALIDDTAASGRSMDEAAGQCKAAGLEVVRCVAFCSAAGRAHVDLFAEESELPHCLEWNWANNNAAFGVHARAGANAPWKAGVAVDFDGVLCVDPPPGLDADEDAYRKWLSEVGPLTLPRRKPLRLVATARRERFRGETLAWLERWGVPAPERLVMFPNDAKRDLASVAAFKAAAYRASGCGLYLESEPKLAEAIHRSCGLPAVCPPTGQVWQ